MSAWPRSDKESNGDGWRFLNGCYNMDGELNGGTVKGRDIFEKVRPLKEQAPEVVVGPDSTPTLSFTSGSEGRPKGVRGRY